MNTKPRRIKKGWMNLLVTDIISENHNTKTLFFIDAEDHCVPFDYTAGQYLTFRFDHVAPKPVVRSYTMSTSPRIEKNAGITVKEVDEGFISHYLCRDVKVGDVLKARGPIGKFCFDPEKDAPHLVMVAAGSGVTPFISIMVQEAPFLGTEGHPERMTLLVAYRGKNDIISGEQLEYLKGFEGRVKVQLTFSRWEDGEIPNGWERGRIDEDKIHRVIDGDYGNKTFMTCGPDEMMELTVHHLLSHGVLEGRIKRESFSS